MRAFAQKGEGETWAEVEEALEREEFKGSKGKPYTLTNLRSRHSRLRGKAPGKDAPPMAADSDIVDNVDAESERERLDNLTREEVTAMLGELETRLRELIEIKLRAFRPGLDVSAEFPDVKEPPLPPNDGKKFRGTKADIRFRVDENLGKLFEADVNWRFGGNASRAMDAILWNFYGKPALSFEKSRETDKEADAWSVLHGTPEGSYDD